MNAPAKKAPKKRASKAKAEDHVYVLRVCGPSGESRNGFVWPESGPVEAPDWDPKPECGNGLHGWLWGEGDVNFCGSRHLDPASRWLVVRVLRASVVDLGGKVKFHRGEVVFSGDRDAAAAKIRDLGARGAVIYGTATAGNYGTATAGYRGTATAGEYGTATAGYRGTATAGEYGTATAGEYGTATAGEYGTATAGDHGTATAGEYGTLIIRWYDCAASRYRVAIGYVGEDGIEAGVAYRLDEDHRFVRAEVVS